MNVDTILIRCTAILTLRTNKKTSLIDLAHYIGVAPDSIMRWKRANAMPASKMKLLQALFGENFDKIEG